MIPMQQPSRTTVVVAAEIVIFSALIGVIWLDEFIDVPYLLFGDPPTPHRLAEFAIETIACMIVGAITIIGSLLILRRLERIERFLRVCAACRKVALEDNWVVFEEYISQQHSTRSSHGICPECFKKFSADTQSGALEKLP
jgi:hypothetical protein